MRLRIGYVVGLIFLTLLVPAKADAVHGGLPTAIPESDETNIEGNGNGETDALLDCYETFAGPQPDMAKIGPPKITKSAANGYVLRADFRDRETVDRLTCSGMGYSTQKNVAVAPLYPRDATVPDPGTAKALAGWRARRSADALKRATARRLSPPDATTAALLEGVWLMDRKPDKGPCLSNWYLETHIEFDFQKSGGRALIFEPYDLFTPVQLAGAEWNGNVLEVQGSDRGGGLVPFLRLRKVKEGQLEVLPPEGKTGPAVTMYRCGDPDRTVTAGLDPEHLGHFFPPTSLGGGLVPAIPGSSDADVCHGKAESSEWKFLQIEAYGPVHYWIFGMGFQNKHRFAFDFIRSIRSIDAHTIKLDVQEHLEKGDGWDVPESRGPSYTLTIIDTGPRLEIPELEASFVKCAPNASATMGMHRW